MNERKLSEIAARFRSDAEQDVNQGLACGTDPRCEYEALVMELSVDSEHVAPKVFLARLKDCLDLGSDALNPSSAVSVSRAI